jgi:hypothetical protein
VSLVGSLEDMSAKCSGGGRVIGVSVGQDLRRASKCSRPFASQADRDREEVALPQTAVASETCEQLALFVRELILGQGSLVAKECEFPDLLRNIQLRC